MKPPSTVVLALLLIIAAATATASSPRPVDIPAQPLDRALSTFSMQSGVQVLFVFASDQIRDAPAVHGSFTPEAALEQLLAGTDLQYQFLDEWTALVQKRPPGSGAEHEATTNISPAGDGDPVAPPVRQGAPVPPRTSQKVNSVSAGDFDWVNWRSALVARLVVGAIFGSPAAVYNVMLLLGALVATVWLLLPAALLWRERRFFIVLWVIKTRLGQNDAPEELRDLLASYKAKIREERPRSWLSGTLQSIVEKLRRKKRNDKPPDDES